MEFTDLLEWLGPVSPTHFLLPPLNSRITVLAYLDFLKGARHLTRPACSYTEPLTSKLVVLRFSERQKFLESLPNHSLSPFGWRTGLGIFVQSHEA